MKRKTLTTAVMAGLTGAAGMISVANAVNVNPDGLGQVLLYPYYTARGGNDTLISVVNTTSAAKAVKIRFLEALNSREVLDFNIYLSKFDVWTGAVTATDDGGAKLLVADTTCTAPYIFGQGGEQEFLDFNYNADPVDTTGDGTEDFPGTKDGGPTGIERTASGHFEIIEMGTIDEDSEVAEWVTHVDGVPADCESVVDLWREPAGGPPADADGSPGSWLVDSRFGFDTDAGMTGGIFGGGAIIDINDGLMFSYNATALDSFWADSQPVFHEDPGNVDPSLTSSSNTVSNVFVADSADVDTNTWGQGILAVNAVLTLDQLMNEYNINAPIGAQTEWVLTYPTKAFHTDLGTRGNIIDPAVTEALPPFTDLWTNDEPYSCDELTFDFWDREEGVEEPPPGEEGDVVVSPEPPPDAGVPERGFVLCRETNVIRFSNDDAELPAETEIFGEPLRGDGFELLSYTNLNLPQGFNSGWVQFDFSNFESFENVDGEIITGLPIIGFRAQAFANDDIVGGVKANYAGTFQHRGTRQAAAQP